MTAASRDVSRSEEFSVRTVVAPDFVLFSSGDADGGLLTLNELPNFVALASSNLVDWDPLTNALSISNGFLLLKDDYQSNFPARYYRIFEP